MSDSIEITLGGESIETYELSVHRLQEWRKKARPIVTAQDEIVDVLRIAIDESDTEQIKHSNREFELMVDEHLVTMLELILDYVPDQTRRTELADKATVDEILSAFFPLARKAYRASADFFMAMWSVASTNGSQPEPTGTNLPDLSGESGTVS